MWQELPNRIYLVYYIFIHHFIFQVPNHFLKYLLHGFSIISEFILMFTNEISWLLDYKTTKKTVLEIYDLFRCLWGHVVLADWRLGVLVHQIILFTGYTHCNIFVIQPTQRWYLPNWELGILVNFHQSYWLCTRTIRPSCFFFLKMILCLRPVFL